MCFKSIKKLNPNATLVIVVHLSKNTFMKIIAKFLILTSITIYSSCSSHIDFIDGMWIDSKKVERLGLFDNTILCYQVQENEFIDENGWRSLCQGIEDFDAQYEEGFIYKISVNKIEIKDPPQDGSSVRYKLKEILSKEKVE